MCVHTRTHAHTQFTAIKGASSDRSKEIVFFSIHICILGLLRYGKFEVAL
jgi:hypothetical protein